MICKVKNAIKRYSMPLRGKTVVVGVSGGADSMALLHVLLSLKDEYGIRLVTCHVNHGIRGETADRDESFVRETCKALGVELRVLKADVPALAAEKHLGIEECGRQVRYDFFNSVENGALVATAHTLSDRCETLLMNITRGTSVKGLMSIPAVRGNIIRPLIDCTRADIERYCEENSVSYITDETNFEDIYSRNRIRLNVITELKKINPSFEDAVLRLIRNAEEENELLERLADDVVSRAAVGGGYSASVIKNEQIAVTDRVLFKLICTQTGVIPETVHVKKVEEILDGGKTEIIGNNIVEVKNSVLRFNPVAEENVEWAENFNELSADTPQGTVSAKIIHKNNLPPKHFVHNKVVNWDSISGSLILRNRRPGDKMRIAGSNCTKTLKKLFNEKHLDNRNNRLVLADESGIVWVQGLGCSDRCKITNKTQKILIIGED